MYCWECPQPCIYSGFSMYTWCIAYVYIELWPQNAWNATLQNATLQNATLQNATLQYATLQNATLWNATLQYATLQNATLQNATLQYAMLQYTTCCNICNTNIAICNIATQHCNICNTNIAIFNTNIACNMQHQWKHVHFHFPFSIFLPFFHFPSLKWENWLSFLSMFSFSFPFSFP
jgi:hypothetical protein